ncbi:MAG: ELM1/GtrOC1 family putative glycosyltransferase [Candidatus Omnitrophica bacterium]|nr:ELM1/GtrOC1 family putative glycosyltransferase [Candidatus Omnitrophota bacterium]
MKSKDFLTDYSIYILFKTLGPLIRLLPFGVSFFIGRALGDLAYLVDLKHRAVAYANIKTALGSQLSPAQIRGLVRKFYRAFGQNIIEIFYIPSFNKKYLKNYVSIEGYDHVLEAFRKGKGVIFVAVHAGGWELANVICANLGFAFSMFVREQNFPHVDNILNLYRSSKGCRFIQRENELRELIGVLKANESVAMTIDQGGKNGTTVKFFNKYASMASGAIRLALKLDCSLVPVFPVRIQGPKIKFWVEPAFKLQKTGNPEEDVRNNLQEMVKIFEKYIAKYPQEYLWTYKSWKYSSEKNILIISDGKTGHLRSSQALAKIVSGYLKAKGITGHLNTVEVKFKSFASRIALTLANCFSGKYICQGCMLCLRALLDKESYFQLIKEKPDVIISCGSSLVPVNYQLSKENQAKSLVIMRPSIFSVRRFDLVVMPSHDKPALRKNVAIIDGALNLIDDDYLRTQVRELSRDSGITIAQNTLSIGLLLGGDTKDFKLEADTVKEVLAGLKEVCSRSKAVILATTSRRTPAAVEAVVKSELSGCECVKLSIIANEKNYSSAVGGILGLSRIVVVSSESISMISEAVSSLKPVVVFKSKGLSGRHNMFLNNFSDKGYIRLVDARDVGSTVERLLSDPSGIKPLKDNEIVRESLRRIL